MSTLTPHPNRLKRLIALILALGLLATACGSDEEPLAVASDTSDDAAAADETGASENADIFYSHATRNSIH